nr:class I SAM-dependent methyltransferase [Ignavibacteriaceae bacterium]
EEIKSRYIRRNNITKDRYSFLQPATILSEQEKERALVKWIKANNIFPLEDKTILEIGCGNGNNILTFLKFGFDPVNIYANELLEERYLIAKKKIPQEIHLIKGNALDIEVPNNKFDIVYQSMVFSSILDKNFKKDLAVKLYDLTKPGGGILWYDFIYNNPRNPDVKGVKLNEIKELFDINPSFIKKITLAPPIARIVSKVHPFFYTLFNSTYIFRTHLLVWLKKNE